MPAGRCVKRVWSPCAQGGDVILAYQMNGVDIPRSYGYPVRAIVPGRLKMKIELRLPNTRLNLGPSDSNQYEAWSS